MWKLFRYLCKVLKWGFLIIISLIIAGFILLELSFHLEDRKYSKYPRYQEGIVDRIKKPLDQHLVLFSVCGVSLSETTRVLVVANHLHEKYPEVNIAMFSYGGVGSFNYTYLIEDSGFDYYVLEPQFVDEEEVDRFYRIDRGEEFGDMFSLDVLRQRIENELDLFKKLQPTVVVGGFVLSAKLSTQIANIPYYFMIPPLTLNWDYYINQLSVSDRLKSFVRNYFPYDFFNKGMIYMMKRIWYQTTNFKKIAVEDYGVNPDVRGLFDIFQGSITFITEIPRLAGMSEETLQRIYGHGNVFVGMLFAKIDKEIPEDILEKIENAKENGKKILYFAMGSSGNRQVVGNILKELDKSFKSERFSSIGLVISPTQRLLGNDEESATLLADLDERIMVTGILPAHSVTKQCDFAITHGGQGTIQTNLASGLPFVGVPSQVEQENNIKVVVEFVGSAIYIPKSTALNNPELVMDGLEDLMSETKFLQAAREFQKETDKYMAEDLITEIIMKELKTFV